MNTSTAGIVLERKHTLTVTHRCGCQVEAVYHHFPYLGDALNLQRIDFLVEAAAIDCPGCSVLNPVDHDTDGQIISNGRRITRLFYDKAAFEECDA